MKPYYMPNITELKEYQSNVQTKHESIDHVNIALDWLYFRIKREIDYHPYVNEITWSGAYPSKWEDYVTGKTGYNDAGVFIDIPRKDQLKIIEILKENGYTVDVTNHILDRQSLYGAHIIKW